MTRSRYYLLAVIVILVCAGLIVTFRKRDERKVRKAFATLAACASKTSGETTMAMARKMLRLEPLFAPECRLDTPYSVLNGTFTPSEIRNLAIQCREGFLKVDLAFSDRTLDFPEKNRAEVRFKAAVIGVLSDGEDFAEGFEGTAEIERIDRKWRFRAFVFEASSL
ncbi:hypothetical protein JW916_04410 [Candidatus Sumerlaeota bacterium]|nr:hypothetical protein [Candidatus Sumerlaeota bacterium]